MALISYICLTCGVQYTPSETPPSHCIICEDDRQYVNPSGQTWTTLDELSGRSKNTVFPLSENLYAIFTEPAFAINQRAHLLITPGGNILWDCISNIDAVTIKQINDLGGIQAIALSHPHYFSTIIEWSRAFGNIPIYVNALDEKWLTYKNDMIRFWTEKELDLWNGIQLIRCGGHFPGASVLFSPQNDGLLLVGDTIQVSPNLKTVSFMYSYPNLIPLPKKSILEIQNAVSKKKFSAMYGAFGKYILSDAKQALNDSVNRYLEIFEC